MVEKLYAESIPKYLGQGLELQILSPMIRGSLGTHNLNRLVQKLINPAGLGRRELVVGLSILIPLSTCIYSNPVGTYIL